MDINNIFLNHVRSICIYRYICISLKTLFISIQFELLSFIDSLAFNIFLKLFSACNYHVAEQTQPRYNLLIVQLNTFLCNQNDDKCGFFFRDFVNPRSDEKAL